MPQEIKQLIGAMNLDDPAEVVAKHFHRDARNVWFRGTPPNRRCELMQGNILRANLLLPGAGVNKTILEKYDSINKCIYFFNFNSVGNHGIYKYNTIPQTFQRIVQVGINTSGDVLGFTADKLTSLDIIYGDAVQGDIIFWIDSLGRPSKINVNRAIAGGYGTIQRSFLDVAKEPPDIVPYVVYENDPANTVNNCRKKLFRVKLRWVFDDNDKSVTSSQSAMPLPFDAFDQQTDADPTKNCRLAITYQTGPSNVKKIEVYVSNSLGTTMSNFYMVASIDKGVSGLSDNDFATYLFYNNNAYPTLNSDESDQLFDYVPQAAVAQANLNGNILDYGNITEGYPNLTNFSNGTTTSSVVAGSDVWCNGVYYSYLTAIQSGASGFGSGNIHVVLRGVITSPSITLDTYTIYMTDGSTITYTAISGDGPADIIAGLQNNAISKGYTIISSGNNDLVVTKINISLARALITTNSVFNEILNTSFNAYDWSSKYGFGLVYYDQKGRTNGAVYAGGFSIQTPAYSEVDSNTPNAPTISASIYHQPPNWAYYFEWVRTKNLSKVNFLQWVSDRTFKDSSTVTGITRYAYISIESVNSFVTNNPGSPLKYSFASGDRVRFFRRVAADGTTANLYGNTKDFEVVASPISPTINGDVKDGQFLKIVLPTTDGTFDFGASGFDNYFIEVYSPAQPIANNLNSYYEFGERYAIANPTLSNRFHQGMNQNQSSDYVTPATYLFTKGDNYARLRAVQTGNIYSFNILQGGTGSNIDTILIGMNFNSSTYTVSGITPQSVPYVPLTGSFNPGGDSRHFLASTPVTTFHVQGTITLTFTNNTAGDSWHIYHVNKFNENFDVVAPFNCPDPGTFTFNVDTHITLENDWMFLIAASSVHHARTVTFTASNLTYTIDHVIDQRCIDPNFSDYFQSSVNSNGRALIFDENANRINFPVLHRWSLRYQQDTNINQANRFFAQNFDEVDRSKGAIMYMGVWDRQLTFFQERKCGQTGIYQKYITDSGGNSQLTTTDDVITSNNVQYYDGNYGVSNQATSIVQSGYVYYFVDPIKSKILRLSKNGITDLTELYKVQTWAAQNIPKYLNPGSYTFGGNQKLLGVFNVRADNVGEYILLAQGTNASAGECMNFEEAYNSFYSKMDIDCDGMVCAETDLYYFSGGNLWKQGAGNGYCNFFGVQKQASLDLVYNDNIAIKKVFNAHGYMSNNTWISDVQGDVQTNGINSQTGLIQQSLLMAQDYDALESPKRYATFNFDMNSNADPVIGLWEGDKLNGELVEVKLKITTNQFTYLYAPFISYKIDQRNP